jgi:hypothetical protein
MGLQETSNKTYLRISGGRVCRSVKEGTEGAQRRETKKGDVIWELVWESLSGVLDSIAFRDDPKYGKSWNLTILDLTDTFVLQVNEDSRYGVDLLKKIPNLHHGVQYTFKPWAFEKDGKPKSGLAITDSNGVKVENFYQTFTEKQDGGWDIKNRKEFPEFKGDPKDRDDLKIYFVVLAKYLRGEALRHIQSKFQEPVAPEPVASDDLPF